jgi:3-hydroxyisobutyrate dehydrogenase-like beta-hydroxyacid dehydrogenase
MGASLAALLSSQGLRVLTTAAGRSQQTITRARAAGVEVLEDLPAVVHAANVVLSTVPPSAARQVCDAYTLVAKQSPQNAVYVDINSIGPELSASLAKIVTQAGREFVDGAIHGQAMSLTTEATLYLAGTRAGDVAQLFSKVLRTRVLSTTAGDASAMKMLLGGISKGMCALFLELSALANRREMVGDFLKESKQFYPGVVSAVDRMLPTYPQHAPRRAE